MAYKQNDVKRKIEYYTETANLLLGEDAYDIASDFFTLAGYYNLLTGDSASAAGFTDKALESCKKGKIQDHHYLFALSLKELNNSNFAKAVEYWNSAKSKYTEDEIELVEKVLSSHKELPPQEKTGEEALDSFLEAAQDTRDRPSIDIFEKIALETAGQRPQTIQDRPQETVTPYWADSEPRPLIGKEVTPQPETTIQEPSEEWQLVSQPLESPQVTPPKISLKEESEPLVKKPEAIHPPVSKIPVPPLPSLKPPIPPATPPPPPSPQKEASISTPKAAIFTQPLPTYTAPTVTPKISAPAKPSLSLQISGKNLYGRIKISDMAWRVNRTDNELTEALSNLINQGKIPGFIQGDEYVQTQGEALTKLSPSATAPRVEAPSQFFTVPEADVSAKTREGYKRCGVCGAELPDLMKICPKCGAKQ